MQIRGIISALSRRITHIYLVRGAFAPPVPHLRFFWEDEENKTGCRFLIVDAYNNEAPLGFYQKNEFLFLFSTEQQEAENLGYDVAKTLHTRLMYYDLKK